MRKYVLQLYDSMQQDIQICLKKGFDEEKEIECCHQMSTKYWRQLQQLITLHHFLSDEEEIDFFKNLKPLFTSEIEYYNLRYHAQLFKPLDTDEMEKFWLRESLRLERFTENNSEFYWYYTKKETGLDGYYFLRRNNESTDFPEANINGIERKISTSHDYLVTELIALEKYNQYVQTQIEKLNNTVTNGNPK